jgi:hypothetical protein
MPRLKQILAALVPKVTRDPDNALHELSHMMRCIG